MASVGPTEDYLTLNPVDEITGTRVEIANVSPQGSANILNGFSLGGCPMIANFG
jgi:hypothetical protein